MPQTGTKKYLLLFYHLLILVLSWYFTIRYQLNISYTYNIPDLAVSPIWQKFLINLVPLVQTIVFLSASVDSFTSLNLWWSKRYSNVKTRSGEFFAWFSTLKKSEKKESIYAVWQSKIYAIFLMINTFFLSLIFTLIFYPTEFEIVFFLSVGLLSLCFIAVILSIRIFLKWMENPLLENGSINTD